MTYQLLLAVLFIGAVLWNVHRIWQYRRSSRYPNGPMPWPLVGNIWTVYKLHTDTERLLADLGKRYGDICMLWIGFWPALVISSAEAAHDILHKVRPVVHKRSGLKLTQK